MKFVLLCFVIGTLVHAGNCDICLLPPDSGSCSGLPAAVGRQTRVFYSSKNLKCTEMPYSGCRGNQNNFITFDQCQQKCGKKLHETDVVKAAAAARQKSKCWFANKTYNIRDKIPEVTRDDPCSPECYCAEVSLNGASPGIECAVVDCEFGPSAEANCTPLVIHKESECCSHHVCATKGKSGGPQPFKCKYQGKEHVEGQYIDQDEYPCITCYCNKSWKGFLTTEGGVCKEANCGLMIHYQHDLINKCEPKFYKTKKGKESCCPIEWKCNK